MDLCEAALEDAVVRLGRLRDEIESGRHPVYKPLSVEEKQKVWHLVVGEGEGEGDGEGERPGQVDGQAKEVEEALVHVEELAATETASPPDPDARHFVSDTDGSRYPLPTMTELRVLYREIYRQVDGRGEAYAAQNVSGPGYGLVEAPVEREASVQRRPGAAASRARRTRAEPLGLPYDYEVPRVTAYAMPESSHSYVDLPYPSPYPHASAGMDHRTPYRVNGHRKTPWQGS